MGISSSIEAKILKVHVNPKKLIYGVKQKENPSGNPGLVGDKHLQHKAYGPLQIRAGYLSDVNKIAGRKEVRRVWGKNKLTLKDVRNPKKAEWAALVYLSHYGKLYAEKTGKVPTIEVYARIHNGGPEGWRNRKTLDYGKAVVRYAQAYRPQQKT